MVITLGDLIIWLLIAALVGLVGELLARRRTPFGIVGAMVRATTTGVAAMCAGLAGTGGDLMPVSDRCVTIAPGHGRDVALAHALHGVTGDLMRHLQQTRDRKDTASWMHCSS